jgi:hypothetical protein
MLLFSLLFNWHCKGEVKRQEREANHSRLSSAEDRNAAAVISTRPLVMDCGKEWQVEVTSGTYQCRAGCTTGVHREERAADCQTAVTVHPV